MIKVKPNPNRKIIGPNGQLFETEFACDISHPYWAKALRCHDISKVVDVKAAPSAPVAPAKMDEKAPSALSSAPSQKKGEAVK